MERLFTDRLYIEPMTEKEMEKLIKEAQLIDPEMAQAYGEMLSGCRGEPKFYDWYAALKICLKNSGEMIGDACFKGFPESGRPEIGYGIDEKFQGRGYATEAVKALCAWAFTQPGVKGVEAETDPENEKSKRVLFKCGFLPTGEVGKEGPRFALEKI